MIHFSRALAGLIVAAPSALAGGLCIFEGVPGGFGPVRAYDESTGSLVDAPAALASVRLLPIDASRRTFLGELDPEAARFVADAGVARLVLPGARGSLYRFVRAEAGGGATFGFFVVDPSGLPRVRFELPSASAADDPFLARVAVSPDGAAFLAATKVAFGGDLYEVATAGAPSFVTRTAELLPRRFGGDGLLLTDTFGAAVSPRGLLRFDRASTLDAELVTFPADSAPAFFRGEIVASRNGQWAALQAGAHGAALHVFVVGAQGAARRASDLAGALSPAGFAPFHTDGPYLAVSDDGQLAAWRREGITRECHLNRVAAAPAPSEHVSSDARFLDTLDEVGLFLFKPFGDLIFSVGERPQGAPTGIEKMDVFSGRLPPASALELANLSLSSGDSTVPFYAEPALEPSRFVRMPTNDGVLLHSSESSSGRVLYVPDTGGGAQVVLPLAKELHLLESAGGRFLVAIRRSDGDKPEELYRWSGAISSAPILVSTQPDGTLFERAAMHPSGNVAYVVKLLAGERVERVNLATGALAQFPAPLGAFGPALAWTNLGAVAFTRVVAGGVEHVVWPNAGAPVLLAASSVGRILPGP